MAALVITEELFLPSETLFQLQILSPERRSDIDVNNKTTTKTVGVSEFANPEGLMKSSVISPNKLPKKKTDEVRTITKAWRPNKTTTKRVVSKIASPIIWSVSKEED